jgi:hypothetical protein
MKRNRKREPLRFGTVARSLVTCICIAGVGLGYVWQKNQIYRLGDEIKKRESALLAAEKRNAMLASQLAQLKSPSSLETRCQQYNLGLVSPRTNQVVRLYEPGPEWDTKFAPAVLQEQPQPRKSANEVVAQR